MTSRKTSRRDDNFLCVSQQVTHKSMGKRKRASRAPKPLEETPWKDDEDRRTSRLQFNSFEELADSEDEFHLNGDKVLLEERPEAKRRRQLEGMLLDQNGSIHS